MREALQARGDPVVTSFASVSLSFALRGGFSLWRRVAVVQVATGVLQMFVKQTNLADFRHFWRLCSKLQRRIFSSVVSTGTASKAKTCPGNLEHGLTCSANGDFGAETRLFPCFSSWLRLFRGEGGPPRFQHFASMIYHELNLYTTFYQLQSPSCCPPMKVTVLRLERTTFTTRTPLMRGSCTTTKRLLASARYWTSARAPRNGWSDW